MLRMTNMLASQAMTDQAALLYCVGDDHEVHLVWTILPLLLYGGGMLGLYVQSGPVLL